MILIFFVKSLDFAINIFCKFKGFKKGKRQGDPWDVRLNRVKEDKRKSTEPNRPKMPPGKNYGPSTYSDFKQC